MRHSWLDRYLLNESLYKEYGIWFNFDINDSFCILLICTFINLTVTYWNVSRPPGRFRTHWTVKGLREYLSRRNVKINNVHIGGSDVTRKDWGAVILPSPSSSSPFQRWTKCVRHSSPSTPSPEEKLVATLSSPWLRHWLRSVNVQGYCRRLAG